MMVNDSVLIDYLEQLLQPELFQDYCPNGLQVAGKHSIRHLVTGVTACQALIDRAIEEKANAILVHHGYFWKGEDPCITGIKHKRIQSLLKNNISLFAYHLPLDAHTTFGNNIQLANVCDFEVTEITDFSPNLPLGFVGKLKHTLNGKQLKQHIHDKLQREPLHIPGGGSGKIKTVCWCTGAAQSYLQQAIDLGVDAYITGEVSEHTVHLAKESGIHFYAAGHHATERYGVKALGEHLAEHFGIKHTFIDIDNPV